jgi:hypothetical protein
MIVPRPESGNDNLDPHRAAQAGGRCGARSGKLWIFFSGCGFAHDYLRFGLQRSRAAQSPNPPSHITKQPFAADGVDCPDRPDAYPALSSNTRLSWESL